MRTIVVLLCTWLLLCLTHVACANTVSVAIVTDGESEWSTETTLALALELKGFDDSRQTYEIRPEHIFEGDWTKKRVERDLRLALADEDIDIVIALGLLAADVAPTLPRTKPVIAAPVIDPPEQGFQLSKEGTSDTSNLHYLHTNVDIVNELSRFHSATGASRIGVVTEAYLQDQLAFVTDKLKELDNVLPFDVIPIPLAAPIAYESTPMANGRVDGVFLLPLFRLDRDGKANLASQLASSGLPTFATTGRPDVENGFLMGIALVPDAQQLARRLAIDVRDLGVGRNAKDLLVSFDVADRLTINMRTARNIEFSPAFDVLLEAEVLHDEPVTSRALSLFSAVDEALKQNLQLAIARDDYELARLDTRLARSRLRPQLDGAADWQALDRDLALTRQTRTTSLGLDVSQVIYSESLYSNLVSTEFLQQAENATLNATQLDVVERTANAYLDILVAKTELEIQQDNLRLTLANLARAEFRLKVGSVNRSEARRFETELGSDRQAVTSARAAYRQALNSLNRVLQRPINTPITVKETGLKDIRIFGDDTLLKYLNSPRQVALFSDFLVRESKQNAPELAALDNEIKSQQRLLTAANRKRYVPDINATASVDRIIDDNGDPFVSEYDNDWSLGVQFSWTLYQGSGIRAEQAQNEIALQRLQRNYQFTQDVIETDTRNAVLQAGASRININYANAAAEAAQDNLDLITDAYVRGTADYIDLIDAQSSFLTARLSSANAVYTHLIDLITLQRAVGFFDFYVGPERKAQWFNSLETFLSQTRTVP